MNNIGEAPSPRVILLRSGGQDGRSFSSSSSGAIKRKASIGLETVDIWATSEVEQETFSFLWTFKNFSTLSWGSEETKSPIFKGGQKDNHHWQLKICPRKKFEGTDHFSVHLILNAFGDGDLSINRKLKIRFQISLIDPDGNSVKQAGGPAMNVCEFKRMSVWGYDKFIQTEELLKPTRRLVVEDHLRIHCRVWIEGEIKHATGLGGLSKNTYTEAEIKTRRLELLSKNFKSVFGDTSYADVSVSTKTKTFLAHKCFLAARSRVFEAMFQSNMLESKRNAVEIDDFEDDVVKAMLEYIYTGETSSLEEKAAELIQIADKYELIGLKEDCEDAIAKNLTAENAAEVLVLANLHSVATLKPKIIEFINRNKEEIRQTDSFNRVAKANVAVFVDLYLSEK